MSRIAVELEAREKGGTAAARRLRRQGMVPAVIYGAGEAPSMGAMQANALKKELQSEAFVSQVLDITVGSEKTTAIVREIQRNPATTTPTHIDFLRVRMDTPIDVHVPLHFIGEDECVGVKIGRGILSKNLVEIEVHCLPGDLPEYLELDVTALEIGDGLHLTDIKLPANVSLVDLAQAEAEIESDPDHEQEMSDFDLLVVSVQAPRIEEEEGEDETAAETEIAAGAPSEDEGDEDAKDDD